MGLPPIHRSSDWFRDKKCYAFGVPRCLSLLSVWLLMSARVLVSGHGFEPHAGLHAGCGIYLKKKTNYIFIYVKMSGEAESANEGIVKMYTSVKKKK